MERKFSSYIFSCLFIALFLPSFRSLVLTRYTADSHTHSTPYKAPVVLFYCPVTAHTHTHIIILTSIFTLIFCFKHAVTKVSYLLCICSMENFPLSFIFVHTELLFPLFTFSVCERRLQPTSIRLR